MNINVLRTVLIDELQAVEDNGEYVLPESVRATILVESRDIMPLPRVRKVRIHDQYLRVTCEEATYIVVAEDIFALKHDDPKAADKDSRPGFGV